jgi:hypothetical protein
MGIEKTLTVYLPVVYIIIVIYVITYCIMLLHYLYLTLRVFIMQVRISDADIYHGLDLVVLIPESGNFY